MRSRVFRESLSAGVSGKAGTVSAAGIVRKMRTVDLQSYDTESYYSAITLAGEECSKRAVQVVGNFLNLLESVLTLALTCVSVIGADWIVPVVAAVSFGFSFWMNQKWYPDGYRMIRR